jgi:predicted secreted protein
MSGAPTVAIAGQGFQLSVQTSASPLTVLAIGQLRTAKRSGSKTKILDITNTDSPSCYEETLPSIISPGDVDFSGIFNPSDTSQIELQTLQDARSLNGWTIALPNEGGEWAFTAYVSDLSFDVDYSKEVTFAGKLSISGPVVYTPGV